MIRANAYGRLAENFTLLAVCISVRSERKDIRQRDDFEYTRGFKNWPDRHHRLWNSPLWLGLMQSAGVPSTLR